MHVYLDNAASTALYPEVYEAMKPYLKEFYGNPSSTHTAGRKARAAIEQARKTIAGLIGATSGEIIFTSGGSAANNIFLQGMAATVPHIISSPIEHPAVLHTLNHLAKNKVVEVSWLALEKNGLISLNSIEKAIAAHPRALVALMHGNNEIGNLLTLDKVAKLCADNNTLFFTDAVQTIGHYSFNVKTLPITGFTASAHKFHGPKGAGFLYLKQGQNISGIYQGGEQERGISIGTENVAGIVGMAKAFELCQLHITEDRQHIEKLKIKLIDLLKEIIPGVIFNGASENLSASIYSVLSVSFPAHAQNEMLLFNLDLANISVSAGSACASGAARESHVLKALGHDPQRAVVRFSLSKFNTMEEIDYVGKKLNEIYDQN